MPETTTTANRVSQVVTAALSQHFGENVKVKIEAMATASLQSLKALASSFDPTVDDLRLDGETSMQMYEYKTVDIPITKRLRKNSVDIETILNSEADSGWKLIQVLAPSIIGQSDMVAVLERQRPHGQGDT